MIGTECAGLCPCRWEAVCLIRHTLLYFQAHYASKQTLSKSKLWHTYYPLQQYVGFLFPEKCHFIFATIHIFIILHPYNWVEIELIYLSHSPHDRFSSGFLTNIVENWKRIVTIMLILFCVLAKTRRKKMQGNQLPLTILEKTIRHEEEQAIFYLYE